MGDTTTLSLRSTFISLTRCTSAFLRKRFFARACYIAEVFGLFENVAIFILEIIENIFDNIASQRKVVNGLVKRGYLSRENT